MTKFNNIIAGILSSVLGATLVEKLFFGNAIPGIDLFYQVVFTGLIALVCLFAFYASKALLFLVRI